MCQSMALWQLIYCRLCGNKHKGFNNPHRWVYYILCSAENAKKTRHWCIYTSVVLLHILFHFLRRSREYRHLSTCVHQRGSSPASQVLEEVGPSLQQTVKHGNCSVDWPSIADHARETWRSELEHLNSRYEGCLGSRLKPRSMRNGWNVCDESGGRTSWFPWLFTSPSLALYSFLGSPVAVVTHKSRVSWAIWFKE